MPRHQSPGKESAMPSPLFSRLLLATIAFALFAQRPRCEPFFWDYSSFVFPNFVAPDVGARVPSAYPLIGVNLAGTSATTADTATIILAGMWTSGELPAGKTATYKHQ